MEQTTISNTPTPAPTQQHFTTLEMVYVAIFAALLAVCSQLQIPLTVPVTLQTFGVFLALEILGGKKGFFSVLVFILLGAIGIPVFAGFTGGLGVLFGSTGGYILGFILTAGIYWLAEKTLGGKLWVRITAMVIGLLLCYTFGTAWFMFIYARDNGAITLGQALSWCVIPFLLPDTIKMVVAFVLGGRLKKYVKL
ncbi:MAG: biotin transporter BioY [Oscillospiraceae bacterium]